MQGGGVLVYARSGILCKVLAKSKLEHVNETEFIILELTVENGQRFLVAAVYRRPKGNVLNSLFAIFYKYVHLYSNVILLGDLNSDLLCTCSSSNYFYTESLKNLIYEHGLVNVPFGATHHATTTGTWLDVVLIDSVDKLLAFIKSDATFILNHDYLIVDYKLESHAFNAFRKFDSDFFASQLRSQIEASPSYAQSLRDPNLLLEQFQTAAIRLVLENSTVRSLLSLRSPMISVLVLTKAWKLYCSYSISKRPPIQ